MSVLEQLLEVQELDTRIDQLRHRRDHLPERDELSEIAAAERDLDTRRREVDDQAAALARSQKRIEDELASVEAKRAEADKRLYSGTVTAPRELQALQDEVSSLGRRTSELEDELLEVLTETEPVDEARAALDAEASTLAGRRSSVEAQLEDAEREVSAELSEVTAAREAASAEVPAETLQDYEARRKHLGGIAIARLHGTSCGGCHLTLSAVEIDRIRKLPPDEPATCEECGRMLVH
ncbi:MAG: C4-type zinc ribbon domain-containing protein [Acidimicrobiales bacterium]|nr:C4-type zinc ribbon domain-containing protein [Acidimicrobiales bacterium]